MSPRERAGQVARLVFILVISAIIGAAARIASRIKFKRDPSGRQAPRRRNRL